MRSRRPRKSRVEQALRRSGGNIAGAARDLGIRYEAFRAQIATSGLDELLHRLRAERLAEASTRICAVLTEYGGKMSAAAHALGIRPSSLASRIDLLGLRSVVATLRPRKPSPAEERSRILDSIRRHRGQIWRVRDELGVSKGTLLTRMRQYDLLTEADALRVEANLIGPRTRLPQGRNPEQRRARIVGLLAVGEWRVSKAARLAGVSIGTFYNMMKNLDIDYRKGERQHRLHRLIDALRLGRGVLERAAVHLGVQARTVSRWCVDYEIDPRDYRR